MLRFQKFAVKVVLFFGGFFAALLILELTARFFNAKQIISVPPGDKQFYIYDPETGWDLKQNMPAADFNVEGIKFKVWTNELGCFDAPYKGEDYIFVVGDSFAFHYAPYEKKWGKAIESDLGFRTLNCGVGGYGTKSDLVKTNKIIYDTGKPPKLIIVGYFLNDFDDDINLAAALSAAPAGGQELGVVSAPAKLKNWTYSHSAFYRFAMHFIKSSLWNIPALKNVLSALNITRTDSRDPLTVFGTYFKTTEGQDAANWQGHLKNIRAFKDLADEQGARLLFVIIPYNFQVYDFLIADKFSDSNAREEYINYPNELLHQAFDEYGISYLDLLPLLRQYADLTPRRGLDTRKDLYYRFDGHWTPKGNELAGALIAQYILENDLAPVQDKEGKFREIEKKLRATYIK